MRFKLLTILLLVVLFQGCEEQYDWALQEGTADLIAVEAVMTNENKNHRIRLTMPYQVQNETPNPASGAQVVIFTSTDTIPTIEFPAGSGMYYTDSMRFVTDKGYFLYIQYAGKTYSAVASQPGVEPLPPKRDVYRKVDEGIYTLNYPESGSKANYTKYYVSWQHLGDCPGDSDCQAIAIHYDLKNVDINAELKPDQEIIYFPVGTYILRKKYSVSDAYKEYLRGMLSETAWRGGSFDMVPANAPTNLSEGAVGFFAISSVVSDTIMVRP